jgi:cytochrome c553
MHVRNRLNITVVLLIAGLGWAFPANAAALRAYGEYLSGECMSCHRPGTMPSSIPSLSALGAGRIADVLREYKSGKRTNPVMVSVAKALTEDQINALGAYFAAIRTTSRRQMMH